MSPTSQADPYEALSAKIDNAMNNHANGHRNSNNPHSFYCDPACVSETLRRVVERELKEAGWEPPRPAVDVLHVHERFTYPDRPCMGEDKIGDSPLLHQCDLPNGHTHSRHMCGHCGRYF